MSALAEVILTGVHNNGTSKDGVGPNKRNDRVGDLDLGLSVGTGFDVAKITNVTVIVGGGTVLLGEGVIVSTSGDTSVGEVTKLVDVESVLAGLKTGDGSRDGDGSSVHILFESDRSLDLVADEDAAGLYLDVSFRHVV